MTTTWRQLSHSFDSFNAFNMLLSNDNEDGFVVESKVDSDCSEFVRTSTDAVVAEQNNGKSQQNVDLMHLAQQLMLALFTVRSHRAETCEHTTAVCSSSMSMQTDDNDDDYDDKNMLKLVETDENGCSLSDSVHSEVENFENAEWQQDESDELDFIEQSIWSEIANDHSFALADRYFYGCDRKVGQGRRHSKMTRRSDNHLRKSTNKRSRAIETMKKERFDDGTTHQVEHLDNNSATVILQGEKENLSIFDIEFDLFRQCTLESESSETNCKSQSCVARGRQFASCD